MSTQTGIVHSEENITREPMKKYKLSEQEKARERGDKTEKKVEVEFEVRERRHEWKCEKTHRGGLN